MNIAHTSSQPTAGAVERFERVAALNRRPALSQYRMLYGDSFVAGIVIYAGEQTLPLGGRLWAMPYSGLWAS